MEQQLNSLNTVSTFQSYIVCSIYCLYYWHNKCCHVSIPFQESTVNTFSKSIL